MTQTFFYSWLTPEQEIKEKKEHSFGTSFEFEPPKEKTPLVIWRCENEDVARNAGYILTGGQDEGLLVELVLANSGLVAEHYLLPGVADATQHIVTSAEVEALRAIEDKGAALIEFVKLGNATFEAVIDFDKDDEDEDEEEKD